MSLFSSLGSALSGVSRALAPKSGSKSFAGPYASAAKASPKSSYISQFTPKSGATTGPYMSVVPKSVAPASVLKPSPVSAAKNQISSAFRTQPASAYSAFNGLTKPMFQTVPSTRDYTRQQSVVPSTKDPAGYKSVVPGSKTAAPARTYKSVAPTPYMSSVGAPSTPKNQYISSLSSTGTSPAPTSTSSFGTVGATDPAPTDVTTTDTSPTTTDTTSVDSSNGTSGSGGAGAGFGGAVTSPTGTGADYRSKYLSLLGGMFSEDELKSNNKKLQEYREKMADAQLEQRHEENWIRENKAGALARGVSGQIAENSRKSAAELADLSIAASPYETYVNKAMDYYKTAADFEQNDAKSASDHDFTLGEGQARYAYDPKTGKYSQVGSLPKASSPEAFNLSPGQTRYAYDPKTGTVTAIATGADPKADEKERIQTQQAISSANTVFSNVDKALGKIGPLSTGIAGFATRNIPGTPAYNLDRIVDTVKANIGFAELSAMRAASPTGGALGQVSEMELKYLQSTIASLDTAQNPQQLRDNLQAVKTHYQNWLATLSQAGAGGGDSGGFAEQW